MSNGDVVKSKRRLIIKIMIPVLIILAIAGIWIFKYVQDHNLPSNNGNPDFALNITEKIDLEKLKSYGLPIIIDFGSDSCIPCKEMAPVLEELNKTLRGKAIIRFADVWKYPDLANGFPLEVIPTQILIDATSKPFVPEDAQAMEIQMYSSRDTNEHVFTAHQGGMTKEQMLAVLKEMGLKE
jgi:thioredoxin 1